MPAAPIQGRLGRFGAGLFHRSGPQHRGRQADTPFDDLERVRALGQGAEGRAELMRSRHSGKLLVLKTIRHHQGQGQPAEVKFLKSLQQNTKYSRIIYFVAATYSPGHASILLEHCSGGDLGAQIQRFTSMGSPVPVPFVLHVAAQLGEALAFLHHGIVRNKGRYGKGSQHEPIM